MALLLNNGWRNRGFGCCQVFAVHLFAAGGKRKQQGNNQKDADGFFHFLLPFLSEQEKFFIVNFILSVIQRTIKSIFINF